MQKKNLQSLKGFRDFLPEEARKRQWLRNRMAEIFESWGYEPIETPMLEPLEIFQGEIGEDEKLFYKFTDQGGRDVMLRYDQTGPTCRFVGENFSKLTFPFKRYQIQPNFRAEKPQKGRYREFLQADIDIFGVESPIADAECIAVSIDLFLKLGFESIMALVSNRDLLKGIPYPVIAAIDKIKKIGREGVIAEIQEKGYSKKQAEDYLNKVCDLRPDEKLKSIFDYLDRFGFKDNYKFEPNLMRSFSYSQGPIWEMVIPEYSVASFGGSVGGGERYDDMVERITGRKIPATGIAFGFDRTLEALEMNNLMPNREKMINVLVTVFSGDLLTNSIEVTSVLRNQGVNAVVYPDSKVKLERQLKYADKKQFGWVVIIGPDEAKAGEVLLKNMESGEEEKIAREKIASVLTERLKVA